MTRHDEIQFAVRALLTCPDCGEDTDVVHISTHTEQMMKLFHTICNDCKKAFDISVTVLEEDNG